MARYTINNIPSDIDFECNNDPTARVLQNAKNLLMLQCGEIPYDRQRGFDQALYDNTITDMNDEIEKEIGRIMLWEPDVEVVDAYAEVAKDGQVIITCEVEIETDE